MTLIVTGFGPFPGVPDNPSDTVVRALDRLALPGVTVVRLPTTWQAADALALPRDAVVLMFGVAASARRIRYEALAHGADTDRPDASGGAPAAPKTTRYSRLPVGELVAEARRAGFPVALSRSPGRYVCNASYRSVLARQPNALFVHIPMPARQGPTSLVGLIAHAAWIATAVPRLRTNFAVRTRGRTR